MAVMHTLKNRLALTTAMVGASLGAYMRQAYAACTNTGGSTYLCTGANASTQTINRNSASVSTASGFSVNTNAGHAINITGTGSLSFTDTHSSTITSSASNQTALRITSTGDNGGGSPSAVTITTSGAISGSGYGIRARSNGAGGIAVTANGNVTSTAGDAISAHIPYGATGTDVSVTTAAGTVITALDTGIEASNWGTGNLSITVNGDVTATNGAGISGVGRGTGSTVYVSAASDISGAQGVFVNNAGTGLATVTIAGDVTATTDNGMEVRNYGTGIHITTLPGSHIDADDQGIFAFNFTLDTMVLDIGGNITAGGQGIWAYNQAGGDIDITVDGDIDAGVFGLNAMSLGGSADVTLNGHIESQNSGIILTTREDGNSVTLNDGSSIISTQSAGIFSSSYQTDIVMNGNSTITVSGPYGAGIIFGYQDSYSTITMNDTSSINASGQNKMGIQFGYRVSHATVSLNDDSSITTSGDDAHGIFMTYAADDNTIHLNGGSITATGARADAMRISAGYYYYYHRPTSTPYITNNIIIVENGSTLSGVHAIFGNYTSQLDVIVDGSAAPVTLTGTSGTAIQLADLNDTLSLSGNITIDGDVSSGGGTDTLTLGAGTITMSDSSNNTISGFENISVTGQSIINGNLNATGTTLTIGSGGDLHVNGLMSASSFTVGNGAVFGGNSTFTGDLIIGSGGTLSPGNSIGTINVTGNITFQSGSTMEVEVDGVTSDLVNATGDVTIDSGVTLQVIPIGAFSGSSIPFLTAGGTVTGTFDTIQSNGVFATIVYDPSSVSFGTLLTATPSPFSAQTQAMHEAGRLFGGTLAEESANGALHSGRRLWLRSLYKDGSRHANGSYESFGNRIYGFAAGADHDVSDSITTGFAFSRLETATHLSRSPDKFEGSATFASLYGSYTRPLGRSKLFSTLGLTGGYHTGDGERSVSNSGTPATATSTQDAWYNGAFMQLGAHTPFSPGWSITPRLNASYQRLYASGFVEQEGGQAGIAMSGYTSGAWKTEETITLSSDRYLRLHGDIQMQPHFTLGLIQEYGATNPHRRAAFSSGTPFSLTMDNDGSHFTTLGIGADFRLASAVTGQINYRYSHSTNEIRNDAMMGVRVRF